MVGHPIYQIKMRFYMDKWDTPPKRVTSPTWGSRPPCKQTLCHYHLVISVSMKFYYYEIRIPGSHYYTMCAINMSGLMAIVTTSQSLRKTTSFHGLTGDPKSLRHCKKLSWILTFLKVSSTTPDSGIYGEPCFHKKD